MDPQLSLRPFMAAIDNIPEALRRHPTWVLWRSVPRDGKATKLPLTIQGGPASSTDPSTWSSFERALEAFQSGTGQATGLGFVFDGKSGFFGVDLDNCLDEQGRPSPEAAEIIRALDSYTEISPSGRGVKIFLKGTLPPGSRARLRGVFAGLGGIEMYSHSRYFTVTGNHLAGTPRVVNERQEAIEALYARIFPPKAEGAAEQVRVGRPAHASPLDDDRLLSKARGAGNGLKFSQLFDGGDTSGHGGDDSAADFGLLGMLTYWTQDPEQLDRLFRRSKLMRPKWDEQRGERTYGRMTIDNALAKRGESAPCGRWARRHDTAAGSELRTRVAIAGSEGVADGAGAEGDGVVDAHLCVPAIDGVEFLVEQVVGNRVTWGLRVDGQTLPASISASSNGRRKREAQREVVILITQAREGWIPTTQEARELEVAIQAVTSSDRVKRFRSTLRGIDQPGSSRANRLAAARIAHEHVIRVFDPRFQDHDRVWSERQGRWLGRGEVIELVDAELLEALGEVCGWAGEGDEFARESSQLRGLMKLVWSRLARELPDEVGAKDLGPESAAGRHFWGQMQGVMLSAAFMVRPGMNVAPEQVSAAMLIRRDRDQRSQGEWKAVGEGIPVWTRWRVVDGARRFEVSTKYHMVQGAVRGKSVESATCSTVLTKLARRYGVADPEVGAVTRAADRPTRLLVLSQDFMEDLLANLEAGGVAQNEDESRNNAA